MVIHGRFYVPGRFDIGVMVAARDGIEVGARHCDRRLRSPRLGRYALPTGRNSGPVCAIRERHRTVASGERHRHCAPKDPRGEHPPKVARRVAGDTGAEARGATAPSGCAPEPAAATLLTRGAPLRTARPRAHLAGLRIDDRWRSPWHIATNGHGASEVAGTCGTRASHACPEQQLRVACALAEFQKPQCVEIAVYKRWSSRIALLILQAVAGYAGSRSSVGGK